MATTDSLVAVADAVKLMLENQSITLGLKDVFYGDQDLIPQFPAAAVEGQNLSERPSDTGFSKMNEFQVLVILYHSKIQDNQTTRREADLYAEAVKAVLNSDRQLGGLVTHCWVSSTDYGYAVRSGVTIRAARILFEAVAKGPM